MWLFPLLATLVGKKVTFDLLILLLEQKKNIVNFGYKVIFLKKSINNYSVIEVSAAIQNVHPSNKKTGFLKKVSETDFFGRHVSNFDFKVDRVYGLNTHLHDAHIDMGPLKFVLFRIYNHVKMCRKQN